MFFITTGHNDTVPPLESVPHTSVHPSEDSDPPVSESEGAAVNSKGSSVRNEGGIWMLIKKIR